ncbi:9078_t:CDS:2, partial [Racocetra persica]
LMAINYQSEIKFKARIIRKRPKSEHKGKTKLRHKKSSKSKLKKKKPRQLAVANNWKKEKQGFENIQKSTYKDQQINFESDENKLRDLQIDNKEIK